MSWVIQAGWEMAIVHSQALLSPATKTRGPVLSAPQPFEGPTTWTRASSLLAIAGTAYERVNNAWTASAYAGDTCGLPCPSIIRNGRSGISTTWKSPGLGAYSAGNAFLMS